MNKFFERYITISLICCIAFVCCGCAVHTKEEEDFEKVISSFVLEKLEENTKKLQQDFPNATISIVEDQIVMIRPMDLDKMNLSINKHENGTYRMFDNWKDEKETIRIDNDVIVLAKKLGSSKQITKFDKDMLCTSFYCETPIEVLKVFYGDIEAGEKIVIKEEAAVLTDTKGKEAIQTYGTPIVQGEEVYLMVLQPLPVKTSNDEIMYGYSNYSRIFPINETVTQAKDREAFLEAIKQTQEITFHELIYADLLQEYIYPKEPDLRIDENNEMRKMIASNAGKAEEGSAEREELVLLKNSASATKEQLRGGLTDTQKEILDRMVKKYGTVSSAAEKK